MLKGNRYDFTEELIGIVDKYIDLLPCKEMSEELIAYATRMMLSLEGDELSGLKPKLPPISGIGFLQWYRYEVSRRSQGLLPWRGAKRSRYAAAKSL